MTVGGRPDALTPFFAPRGVAVVGASRDPAKVGGSVLANLRSAGFEGRVWPVNPRADIVQGLPATASLLAISEPVDLAVIAVPAPAVLPAPKDCVAKGIRGAIVLSAGLIRVLGGYCLGPGHEAPLLGAWLARPATSSAPQRHAHCRT
jgi:acyl-CoA synthetase (NDP forming)